MSKFYIFYFTRKLTTISCVLLSPIIQLGGLYV